MTTYPVSNTFDSQNGAILRGLLAVLPVDDKMGASVQFLKQFAPYAPYAAGALGVLGGLLLGWLHHRVLPVIHVKLELIWGSTGLLHIRLKAENTSKVPARMEYAVLQRLEHKHTIADMETLDDFIPFEKADWERMSGQYRPDWMEPLTIVRPRTDQWIKQGEAITVDVLYRPSAAAFAVHCGFRVKLKSWTAGLLHGHHLRFTTTAWAPRLIVQSGDSGSQNAEATVGGNLPKAGT